MMHPYILRLDPMNDGNDVDADVAHSAVVYKLC